MSFFEILSCKKTGVTLNASKLRVSGLGGLRFRVKGLRFMVQSVGFGLKVRNFKHTP